MKLRVILVSAVCLIFFNTSGINALECPKQPEQVKKNWETEVNLAVVKIGPAKGAELKTKVKNVTQDLLGKLPNADRVYLEQMMYASYCSAIRDDKTLSEAEKLKRLKIYNTEVRKAFLIKPTIKKKIKFLIK